MGATQAMKRIPLIKFPQRHRKPSGSASASQAVSADGNAQQSSFTRMKVPVAPSNVGSGGKALSSQNELQFLMRKLRLFWYVATCNAYKAGTLTRSPALLCVCTASYDCGFWEAASDLLMEL
ncbi:hypothetical protein CK203_015682 [Vitis vinifera]|uniref:Uncharacterized protein n=1 Tax=Vitis vinifera TaxID=29760 RepID=A0A438J5P6_VITVI|nr:hypothetical protein CK203_015682 [Vitis vinifera]